MDSTTQSLDGSVPECEALCNYLAGQPPTQYIIDKYGEGVTVNKLEDRATHKLDRYFKTIVLQYPVLIRVVDAYTSVFGKSSTFRMKLVLMLAILECCPPTHIYLDKTDTTSKIAVCARGTYEALIFIFSLMLSLVLFLPLYLMSWAKAD